MEEYKQGMNQMANEILGKFQEAEFDLRNAIQKDLPITIAVTLGEKTIQIPICYPEAIAELQDFLSWNIEWIFEEYNATLTDD